MRHVATKQSNLNSITQSKNSATHSKNSATQSKNPTQKHPVPCPYLRKKGHCLKGPRCDFSHQFDPQQASKPYRPYNVQLLFKDNIPSTDLKIDNLDRVSIPTKIVATFDVEHPILGTTYGV